MVEGFMLSYAYYTGFYLYNLVRGESPFNFLVIDTPNQQGQDKDNLKSIFQSLDYLMSDNGQVIVGSESSTGFEKGHNVIRLKDFRKCLDNAKYSAHFAYLERLYNVIDADHGQLLLSFE